MRMLTRRAVALFVGSAVASTAMAQTPPPAPQPVQPVPPTALPPAVTPAPAKPEVRPTGTAATVNNQQIPEVAVYRALRQFPPTEHAVARKEIINHLVENILVDQYLNALKVTIEPAETDKLIEELKGELKKTNKDYAKELDSMMLTEAEFRTEVIAQQKWDKFLKDQGTDQKLKDFFDKRPDIFDGTLVRARHILLTPGTDAAKIAAAKKELLDIKAMILVKAKETADATQGAPLVKEQARTKKIDELFSEAAKQHSTCPSKSVGGDLQFFPRIGAMVEPFSDAAFRLNLFEMSDVVETEFGLHLILQTAKNPGKPRKFEEVKEDVRAVYAMQLRTAVVTAMKPKAQIVITPAAAPEAPK